MSDGKPLHHFSVISSHAEFCVIEEKAAVRIPDCIPWAEACLLGCGVITGYGAIRNVAVVRSGESVGVFGCGAVGLNVVKSAQLAGASQVTGIDPLPPDAKERCPLWSRSCLPRRASIECNT